MNCIRSGSGKWYTPDLRPLDKLVAALLIEHVRYSTIPCHAPRGYVRLRGQSEKLIITLARLGRSHPLRRKARMPRQRRHPTLRPMKKQAGWFYEPR